MKSGELVILGAVPMALDVLVISAGTIKVGRRIKGRRKEHGRLYPGYPPYLCPHSYWLSSVEEAV